jgi:hypothetical protein
LTNFSILLPSCSSLQRQFLEGTVAPQALLQRAFNFNFDATQRQLITMCDSNDGLTAEQTAAVQALKLSMRLDNVRAMGTGATPTGAGGAAAGTADQSARDVMMTFVNRQLSGNASGLAAGNSSGLGKRGADNSLVVRGADSSLEAARAMAAADHSARTSAMLNESTAASALERDIDSAILSESSPRPQPLPPQLVR